jgi:hypothetical protein
LSVVRDEVGIMSKLTGGAASGARPQRPVADGRKCSAPTYLLITAYGDIKQALVSLDVVVIAVWLRVDSFTLIQTQQLPGHAAGG